jgi:hypothetical protein
LILILISISILILILTLTSILTFSGVAFDKSEGHPRVFTASTSQAILSPQRACHAEQKQSQSQSMFHPTLYASNRGLLEIRGNVYPGSL